MGSKILNSVLCACTLFGFVTIQLSTGETYLAPTVYYRSIDIRASTGEVAGWLTIKLSDKSQATRHELWAFKGFLENYFVDQDSVTALITTSDASIYVGVRVSFQFISLFPTSVLGTKYIFSSCQNHTDHFYILIATYDQPTNINITFNTNVNASISYGGAVYRTGNTLQISAQAYHTYTVKSTGDLSETVITASYKIAVFSGLGAELFIYDITQLLPVEYFGREFFVTADNNLDLSTVQFVSEHNDTVITYSDGQTGSVRQLKQNETLFMTSNTPAMATLCRPDSPYNGYITLMPTSYFTYKTTVWVWRRNADLKIAALDFNPNITVTSSDRYDTRNLLHPITEWTNFNNFTDFSNFTNLSNFTNTTYQVGSLSLKYINIVIIYSTHPFTVFLYDMYRLMYTGFNFSPHLQSTISQSTIPTMATADTVLSTDTIPTLISTGDVFHSLMVTTF